MGARVLVIDDDPVNLDLITYLLTAFGHAPIPAEGAEAALEAVRKNAVDLILCDIQMPGTDGFEFLRQLNEEGRHKVPIVGVTALAMVGDREKVLAAGFDGYMAKPITPETFVKEVERYLNAAQWSNVEGSETSAVPPATVLPIGKKQRILIVDNTPENLALLRMLLEYTGYRVTVASSGREALKLADQEPPALILSDIHMPNGDGFELIQAARQVPLLRSVPFMFISSTTYSSATIDYALSLGAKRVLIRPIEPEELLAAVSDCLEKSAASHV